jgi:M3 family oligoendopeptidase
LQGKGPLSVAISFADIHVVRPTPGSLADRYRAIHDTLDRPGGTAAGLAEWDRLRREVETWQAMVGLRFQQNTADPAFKADRDYADSIAPEITRLEIEVKRRLLAAPGRDEVAGLVGGHALRLWETDILTFEPAIAADLEQEAKVAARYTELLAGARIAFGGATLNLAGLEPHAQALDRATRHRAEQARWDFFAANGAELDQIYDELVRLRHGMARKLGYESYTTLGYRRMRRVDYGPADVARYRDEIAAHVVPVVGRVLERRRFTLGLDRLSFWDEAIDDPAGNPGPAGDHDFLVARAEALFDRVDPRLADFYRAMRDGGLLDLRNRPDKAGGGFCTSFPAVGVPFIFANFNGTDHDVTVFTHEMGHAFQNWRSRDLGSIDYLWPTSEAAEISSMGLEFLTHPQIGLLVGAAAAERFRRVHLLGSLRFLPYGACVDHFQHEIYADPRATPAERHAIWQRLERRYMPWRDYGDLAYPAKGGLWQAKLHIYQMPFYYIDYTLALCCAMQLWVRSLTDYPGALETYVALCGRGGSAPFDELVRSAGLISPFQPGVLAGVVGKAEEQLAA